MFLGLDPASGQAVGHDWLGWWRSAHGWYVAAWPAAHWNSPWPSRGPFESSARGLVGRLPHGGSDRWSGSLDGRLCLAAMLLGLCSWPSRAELSRWLRH